MTLSSNDLILTGVGSRNITREERRHLNDIAYKAFELGYVLRSGHAVGSDYAFEEVYAMVTADKSRTEIFLPFVGYNRDHNHETINYIVNNEHIDECEKIIKKVHGAYEKLSDGAKQMHFRNVKQVLGDDLNTPTTILIACSDPRSGGVKGGTSTAWKIAKSKNIPCFNLRVDGKDTIIRALENISSIMKTKAQFNFQWE